MMRFKQNNRELEIRGLQVWSHGTTEGSGKVKIVSIHSDSVSGSDLRYLVHLFWFIENLFRLEFPGPRNSMLSNESTAQSEKVRWQCHGSLYLLFIVFLYSCLLCVYNVFRVFVVFYSVFCVFMVSSSPVLNTRNKEGGRLLIPVWTSEEFFPPPD